MEYIKEFIKYKESKGEKAIYKVNDTRGYTYYSDDYVLWLEQQLHIQGLCLAKKVIEILDKKCRRGCTDPTWVGFQNGDGSECGIDIERLIKQAKRLIFTLETKK